MNDNQQRELAGAIEQWVEAKEYMENAKALLSDAMVKYDCAKFEHPTAGYTAFRRTETRKSTNPILLLSAGVQPSIVAECATGVNRKELVKRGVDPETLADCTIETEFVKCFASKNKAQ